MKSQELCLFSKDELNLWKRIYLTFGALLATWEEQPFKGTDPAVGWRVPMEAGWALVCSISLTCQTFSLEGNFSCHSNIWPCPGHPTLQFTGV